MSDEVEVEEELADELGEDEAVKQVRGTAINQIDGAENVLVIAGASPSPTSGMVVSAVR